MADESRTSLDISKPTETPVPPVADEGTQTSEEGSEGDGESQTPEGQDDETGTEGEGGSDDEGDAGKDDVDPDTGKPFDYKVKFSASSAENQRIVGENTTLTGSVKQLEDKLTAKDKEIEELRKVAEGKNPEGLNILDLKTSSERNAAELATLKEGSELDNFFKGVKVEGAESRRDALKALARANPQTALQKLWDDNLKSGAEADAARIKERREKNGKGASDRGRGTSGKEKQGETVGTTGLTRQEFDALSVAKRRELIVAGKV